MFNPFNLFGSDEPQPRNQRQQQHQRQQQQHQQQQSAYYPNQFFVPPQFRGRGHQQHHHAPNQQQQSHPSHQQQPHQHQFFYHFGHQPHFQQQQPTGPPPTSKKALDTLPVFYYTLAREYCMKNREGRLEQDNCCTICLDYYQTNDKLIQLPCQHIFHHSCSHPWLAKNNTCPQCRFELPVEDAQKERERVTRVRELFTADGLRIMEIRSQVELAFEKVLNVREVVEPGHQLDQEIISHFAEMLDSCDGALMKATLELDAMQDVRLDRVRQQRKAQVKNIQFVQAMIDEIRSLLGINLEVKEN
jgi:hypothetical protein